MFLQQLQKGNYTLPYSYFRYEVGYISKYKHIFLSSSKTIKTAPQHPETWGTQGGSHPPPVLCHRGASGLPQWLPIEWWMGQPLSPQPLFGRGLLPPPEAPVWFARISLRPTGSPPQTFPRPEFLLPRLPVLLHAWPASTHQLPQESPGPTRLDRTPSSAWRHPLLLESTTGFMYCLHDRNRRRTGHHYQQHHSGPRRCTVDTTWWAGGWYWYKALSLGSQLD